MIGLTDKKYAERGAIFPSSHKTRKSPKKKAFDSLGRTPFKGKFRWK